MLNMIKMDVYRMFRTKSMYVIWIILLASALLTSFLSKIDYDAVNKEWELSLIHISFSRAAGWYIYRYISGCCQDRNG